MEKRIHRARFEAREHTKREYGKGLSGQQCFTAAFTQSDQKIAVDSAAAQVGHCQPVCQGAQIWRNGSWENEIEIEKMKF